MCGEVVVLLFLECRFTERIFSRLPLFLILLFPEWSITPKSFCFSMLNELVELYCTQIFSIKLLDKNNEISPSFDCLLFCPVNYS